MVAKFLFLFFLLINNVESQTPSATSAGSPKPVQEKDLEVAIGIDVVEKIDFDFNSKVDIGKEEFLRLRIVPQRKEIIFKGQKPGKTNVTILDSGTNERRLVYNVVVTATGKSSIVSELKELIGDVEGLDIGIKGGKVVVEGEIIVPDDIGKVTKVLASYQEVLSLIELSPQTQRVIARKMSDELAKNNLKDVTVRVVNKTFWLEGVVASKEKKELAVVIAKAYLPPRVTSLSQESKKLEKPEGTDIIDFIAVNEKKEPQPAPKMVKISSQFVELSKSYNKIFAFKWAPLMGEDASQISFGQTADGNITSTSSGTLSATISNLFPKLNSAKTAGYARVIQSGMVITRDTQQAKISKTTSIPFAVGTGEFTKADKANVGLTMQVTPKILEQEKIELGLGFDISLAVSAGSTPITTTNNISTNVVVKSKESAAIGGVVQNQSNTEFDNDPASAGGGGANGQPPPTPLFRLFRSKSYVTNKSQYVVFITPEIIESASAGTEEIRKKFRRRE